MTDRRTAGRRAVFASIRRAGLIARVDLARETGLSPATITAITAELIGAGLIEETKTARALVGLRRGRPRVALKINGPARRLAGVKISASRLSAVAVDFEGGILAELEEPWPADACPADEAVERAASGVVELARRAGLTLGEFDAVGLAVDGTVDAGRGLVHDPDGIIGRDLPLVDLIGARLRLPVFVDHGPNQVARAEQYFGVGRGVGDFIVVIAEHDIGLGVVIDHQIFRGARGRPTCFGHTKVVPGGALCRCGQRGCLQAHVANDALSRAVTPLHSGAPGPDQQQADQQDAAADHAGQLFAMSVANMVHLFDPELVILTGQRMPMKHLYTQDVFDSLRAWCDRPGAPPPRIELHKWNAPICAMGAAAHAMAEVSNRALYALGGEG